MPGTSTAGNRLLLNLQARFTARTDRLGFNLGVSGEPTDPGGNPEPVVVVGLLVAAKAAKWDRLTAVARPAGGEWGALFPRLAVAAAGWARPAAIAQRLQVVWTVPTERTAGSLLAWAPMRVDRAARFGSTWSSPPQHGAAAALAWSGTTSMTARSAGAAWIAPPATGRAVQLLWQGAMRELQRNPRGRWNAPPLQRLALRIPWGRGNGLEWLVRPPAPEPPPGPPAGHDRRRVGLNLGCQVFRDGAQRLPLNLGITACWLARPQRRAYVVLNEISVVRLPDRLPLHVDAVALTGGRDSWCWDASLALADPSQLEAVAPTVDGPRSVEITLNGYSWVVAIEGFDRSQVFGATEVAIRGRSATAQLAEPYAAPRTREATQQRTMVQLADAEVAGSGVTVDYGAVSWLVPAGAWYYDGLTPMSALMRLAEASGAVVQSHPSLPEVQIRPRYPVSPWNWTTTTPDVVIQDDVVTGTRLQLQSRPLFDAVIASGERVGVSARVRRTGEAGQTYAPQQVDQLITHADAARERGRNVLSDRGGQASVEHDLPLFGGPLQSGQPGLVLPLMLAQRVTGEGTWHGLVTAVRIEARRQDKAVDVVQTVTIERHYTDAD